LVEPPGGVSTGADIFLRGGTYTTLAPRLTQAKQGSASFEKKTFVSL
jgi:hypothetical protein